MTVALLRATAAFLAFAGITLTAPAAAAGPIVLDNSSYTTGLLQVVQGGVPNTVASYNSTDWDSIGLSGDWNRAGSAAGTGSGSVFVASSTRGTLSPTLFTGIGLTWNRTAVIEPDTGSRSWAMSVHDVTFELTTATSFAYSGHYFGTTDADLFGGLVGSLRREDGLNVFSDEFGLFQNLDETRSYSGTLAPGTYRLFLASQPLTLTAPGGTFKDGGFDFSLAFTPGGSEVPEPSTILLIGTGVAWLVRRRVRR